MFFEDDYTCDHYKHLLMHKLGKYITKNVYNFDKQSLRESSLVADLMANIRKINVLHYHTFKDIFKQVWNTLTNSCHSQRIDIIYAS